jgi:formylglycine-generating enzyme required for sulfatase activity
MKLQSIATVALVLALTASMVAAADEERPPKFPFPVEVDEAAGETKAWPNRVKDRVTGMQYRLVPDGKYVIGSDAFPDSKKITVQLSPYYISQRQVTYGQFQKFIKAKSQRAWEEFVKDEIPKGTPQQQVDDIKLMTRVVEIIMPWSPHLPGTFDSKKDSQLIGVFSKTKDGRLSKEQRTFMTAYFADYDARVDKLLKERGAKPLGRCGFETALEFAKWRGADLPTEAQWEVAAELTQSGAFKTQGLFDDVLEWCGDYYSYKYFQRTTDFENPTGPLRGHLSRKRIEQTSSSRLRKGSSASSMRVLRGKGVSTRSFGRNGWREVLLLHSSSQKKGIRLVINPRVSLPEN